MIPRSNNVFLLDESCSISLGVIITNDVLGHHGRHAVIFTIFFTHQATMFADLPLSVFDLCVGRGMIRKVDGALGAGLRGGENIF